MCSLSDFCTVDGEEQALWQRVTSYAQDMYAMKDVFAMDSTVRVDAIENLGKFFIITVHVKTNITELLEWREF